MLALFATSRGAFRQGFARRLKREKPSAAYEAGELEEVELSELMAIMRSPEKLQEVNWSCTESFTSTMPGSFSGLGRCSRSKSEIDDEFRRSAEYMDDIHNEIHA